MIHTWCSRHFKDHEQRIKATQVHTLAADSSTALAVELCEDCWRELFAPAVAALTEYGEEPLAEERSERQQHPLLPMHTNQQKKCPLCGHVAPNRGAYGAHIRSAHAMTMAEAELQAGIIGVDDVVECPECGSLCYPGAGLAAHRRNLHGAKLSA